MILVVNENLRKFKKIYIEICIMVIYSDLHKYIFYANFLRYVL
jgi:hypothetical protein